MGQRRCEAGKKHPLTTSIRLRHHCHGRTIGSEQPATGCTVRSRRCPPSHADLTARTVKISDTGRNCAAIIALGRFNKRPRRRCSCAVQRRGTTSGA